jgi:hypothetical protein
MRSVAAKIRFPPSTAGAALTTHSLAQARMLAAGFERDARAAIKREQRTENLFGSSPYSARSDMSALAV